MTILSKEITMLKYTFIMAFTLFLITLSAQSPNWQWVNSYGEWNTDSANDMVTDPMGNIYTTGTIGSSVNFGSTYLDGANGGAFIAKHYPDGSLAWAVNCGNNGYGIALDTDNNVYVVGDFEGTKVFGINTLVSAGITDVFVAKLNGDGEWQWAVRAGSDTYDYPKKITVDSLGNAYILGMGNNTMYFGDYTVTGSWKCYVAKVNAAGVWQWANYHTGVNYNSEMDIAIDTNDVVYVTATVFGAVSFGTYSFSSNHFDVLVSKLDTAGNFVGYYRSTGSAPENAEAITIAADGSVYVSGYFYTQLGSPLFGTLVPPALGVNTLFIAKLSNEGSWVWVRSAGTGGTAQSNKGYALDTDSEGNVYMTGTFTYDGIFGGTTLTSYGSIDLYVASLDNSGNWRWAEHAGCNNDADYGLGISVTGVDNVYVCGSYRHTGIFGDISVATTVDNWYSDIFIAKFGYPGPKAPENIAIQLLEGNVELSWDPVTTDTGNNPIVPTAYHVYYQDDPSGTFVFLGESATNQFTHANASLNDCNFYRIVTIVE
jgi:hypothetical protein